MPIKIYVTDDDPSFRTMLGHALERAGHQYVICANSDELIEALSISYGPAIVFLDIHMGDEDGISTIKRFQVDNRRFRLRFITGGDVTTAIAASLIAKGHDIDVGRTLYKPFPMDRFIDAVTDDIGLVAN